MINIIDALIDALLFIEIVSKTDEERIDVVLDMVNEIKPVSAIGTAAASGASAQRGASNLENKTQSFD